MALFCSSFSALEHSTVRYLWVLAMLELRQPWQSAGYDSDRAKYQASCFRPSAARIAAAMAKAAIMRFASSPSLPAIAQYHSSILRTANVATPTFAILHTTQWPTPFFPLIVLFVIGLGPQRFSVTEQIASLVLLACMVWAPQIQIAADSSGCPRRPD
jgi:hypothetical protein